MRRCSKPGLVSPTFRRAGGLPWPFRHRANGFAAADYDLLVDAPVEIGTFQESDFDEGGGHLRHYRGCRPLRLRHGEGCRYAAAAGHRPPQCGCRIVPLRPMCFSTTFRRAHPAMAWSTPTAPPLMSVPRRWPAIPRPWHAHVTAHEFFHLWNVKSIRPQSLEPVDYSKKITLGRSGSARGTTSTAANIILLRAGLLDPAGLSQRLAGEIGELERRPAHLTQSAEDSSLDAWLEKYDYYRLPARSISYYNKGDLLGCCWT